jgi:hypothetical protein
MSVPCGEQLRKPVWEPSPAGYTSVSPNWVGVPRIHRPSGETPNRTRFGVGSIFCNSLPSL